MISVIVNPASAVGRTARRWPRIRRHLEASLGGFEAYFTEGPMDAARIARDAAGRGANLVISVGGDGTLNETVNGLLGPDGRAVNPDTRLGVVTSGSGGDFRRSLGHHAGPEAGVAAITSGAERRIDAARVTYRDLEGRECTRLFINMASFGLSGLVARNVAAGGKGLLVGAAYIGHAVAALAAYRATPLRLRVDGAAPETQSLLLGGVANGAWFGGGLKLAPGARPDDGRLGVVLVGALGLLNALGRIPALYRGAHIDPPDIRELACGEFSVAPEGDAPVFLDIDGEFAGRLPARFEILPGALILRG
ncbi:MAG: YegS/Rv2252/BmrU family lipid kinase [Maricaulaceae bacterium]|nr:YegS/Rv2252/BmrU family lipid kinase [Maricaulaceae bacterium]